jgi:manganese/zinc/iron transport system ATP- binding protein
MLQRVAENVVEAAPPIEPSLGVRDLSVTYGGRPALWSVDYDAPRHGLVAVIGPNGAGKSTFLKACLGLVPRLSGSVEIFGRPVDKARELVAYVPQRSAVDWDFPVTVLDVVTMGRYGRRGLFRRVRNEDREAAHEALGLVGMQAYSERQIGELSGGQQQRVFLARALAQGAQLFLMDEPLAGVDAATEHAILDVLHALDTEGRTVICVHHDLDTVAEMFDHVLILNGRKIAAGPVPKVFTPEALAEAYGGRLATARAGRARHQALS